MADFNFKTYLKDSVLPAIMTTVKKHDLELAGDIEDLQELVEGSAVFQGVYASKDALTTAATADDTKLVAGQFAYVTGDGFYLIGEDGAVELIVSIPSADDLAATDAEITAESGDGFVSVTDVFSILNDFAALGGDADQAFKVDGGDVGTDEALNANQFADSFTADEVESVYTAATASND